MSHWKKKKKNSCLLEGLMKKGRNYRDDEWRRAGLGWAVPLARCSVR